MLEGTGGELIEGNLIGTDTDGTTDHGNGGAGVYINGAPGVVLRNNVISGNDSHGVSVSGSGATGTSIYDNVIGTNAAGTADLGNTASGVHVSGARDTVILKNIISGNDSHGVSLTGSGTRDTLVAENYIGTNSNGTSLGNTGSGIHIEDNARDNLVEDNTIANNVGDGVTIADDGTTGNTVWENSIHSNGGLGIDLADDGITANDSGDSDSGPNHLQNFPVLNVFAVRGDQAAARFSLDVIGGRLYIVDFYANDSCDTAGGNGEGKEWLGFTPVQGSTSGNLTFNSSTLQRSIGSFSAPTGTLITATATDTVLDETSEFSACKVRVPLPELEISPATIGVTEDSTTSTTYTVALSSLPTAETKVTMSVDDSAVATISPDTLTFTTTDGTTAQEVTVTGVSDADPVNETTTILHLVSIGDHEFPTALLPVKVIDDDAPVLTLTHTNFPSDVSEGLNYDGVIELDEGDTETYTVELAAEPPGDVTISLLRSNSAALTVSPSSITFTKTGEAQDADKWEWRDPQTVTLTPVSDSDASDEICTIRHESTIGGKNYVLAQARILVRDLALPGLKFEQLSVTVDEISVVEGSTASYTVVPNAEPSADLTVVVVSVDEATVTVEPDSITFTVGTGGNWETAQTVTVTGVSDDDEFDDFTDIGHGTLYDEEVYLLGTVSVTVTDGNRAPYFEEGVDTTRAVAENAGQGATVGAPVTALDLNTGDTLTYTLDDQSGKFSINSTTGQITVAANASLDYEVAQDYSMDVTVEDRQTDGLTDKIEVKVLVTGVNEPPVITGEASPTFREDTRITSRVARYSATDPERDSFTWSVEGTDGGAFDIDAGGNLKFNSQPDHETKGEYSITIVATDDGDPAESGELRVSVEVTDVNEAPEIYQGAASHTYDENDAHPVDQYFARDPEGTTSFTWSLSGSDRGDFTITGGQLQFANTPNYERPADSGGNNVYNVTVRASDGSLTGTKDVIVTVTDVNEEPSEPTGSATITVAENTTSNLARYSTTDPERATIEWSVTGNDSSAFRVDSSGNLAFDGAPDYEAPTDTDGNNIYNIAVTATDDGTLGDRTPSPRGRLSSSFDVTVTVTPVDEPPVITGTTTISNYDENTPATNTVASYTADDPEGDTNITWGLAGADRGDFTITSGELKFASTPDYERPADSGRDNHYDVTVVATDSNNKRGEQHVDVIVKNVDEPPEITGPETVDDFPENASTSRQVARYTATDPDRATVTLSLTAGGDEFTLASNGTVTFKESPDFEDQNRYNFTVSAMAGSHTVDRPVTVNIQNLEEQGTVTLSAVQPQEGTGVTAELEDGDDERNVTWQWYRTSSRGSTGTVIGDVASGSNTAYIHARSRRRRGPLPAGRCLLRRRPRRRQDCLRRQRQPGSGGASAAGATCVPVHRDYGQRTIRENMRAGRNLGAPVTATDANNDRLTYSITPIRILRDRGLHRSAAHQGRARPRGPSQPHHHGHRHRSGQPDRHHPGHHHRRGRGRDASGDGADQAQWQPRTATGMLRPTRPPTRTARE